MDTMNSNNTSALSTYRQIVEADEVRASEQLSGEIEWLEGEIRKLKLSLEDGSIPSETNIVTQAGRVQAAALRLRAAQTSAAALRAISGS